LESKESRIEREPPRKQETKTGKPKFNSRKPSLKPAGKGLLIILIFGRSSSAELKNIQSAARRLHQ